MLNIRQPQFLLVNLAGKNKHVTQQELQTAPLEVKSITAQMDSLTDKMNKLSAIMNETDFSTPSPSPVQVLEPMPAMDDLLAKTDTLNGMLKTHSKKWQVKVPKKLAKAQKTLDDAHDKIINTTEVAMVLGDQVID